MAAHLRIDLNTSPQRAARRRDDSQPLRVLVLAELSGQVHPGGAPAAKRTVQRIDTDNFDARFAQLAPRCVLHDGRVLHFESLDDFHPDRLLQTSANLVGRLALLRRLDDPGQFAAALAELNQNRVDAPAAVPPDAADTALLSALLGGAPAPTVREPAAHDPLAALLRRAVADHVVPDNAAQRRPYADAARSALAEQLRTILHDPAFQTLEATWRSLQGLVFNLPGDAEAVAVHALDVGRGELAALLEGHRSDSAVHGLGDMPWDVIAADFSFDAGDDDVALLAALGHLGGTCGAPVLAGAAPGWLGLGTFRAPWPPGPWGPRAGAALALRRSALAPWIGLFAPRILLRRPYGPRSDPVDAFGFEELPDGGRHEQLLWGTAAVAAARLFAAARVELADLDTQRTFDDLPLWLRTEHGEQVLQPVCEDHLDEAAAQRMLDAGVMPLMSLRQRNGAVLLRWASLASPAAPLAEA
jgi:type VI secretion system protein ImpC